MKMLWLIKKSAYVIYEWSLSVDNLMAITQLTALKHLELGNCDLLEPQNLFLRLSELSNLKYLRLERGKFNECLGVLSGLKSLTDLELIDFEMMHGCGQGLISLQGIRKLLLIPTYKDDVSIYYLVFFTLVLIM